MSDSVCCLFPLRKVTDFSGFSPLCVQRERLVLGGGENTGLCTLSLKSDVKSLRAINMAQITERANNRKKDGLSFNKALF